MITTADVNVDAALHALQIKFPQLGKFSDAGSGFIIAKFNGSAGNAEHFLSTCQNLVLEKFGEDAPTVMLG